MKRLFCILLLIPFFLLAQNRPFRIGTTTAAFLEIGYGGAGVAMGDAYVTMARDVSAIYWNPAGLAFMQNSEASFSIQPWIVDINTSFVAAGAVVPGIGTIALSITSSDYGDMEVTNVDFPDGTGEYFSANDYAISLAYARQITNWFAFGAAGKYIGSKIWHMNASAIAVDLGVSLNTAFFSPTGNREDGMRIAMSISNYGTRMKYDGMDLLQSIDIKPNEDGNYANVQGKYELNEWELPLIFRLGIALNVLKLDNHSLFVAFDALHPNNNAESGNVGGEYQFIDPSFGKFSLRAGYKGLFLDQGENEFGLTFGAGFEKFILGNMAVKVDYAYRDIGVLGKVHCYSFGLLF